MKELKQLKNKKNLNEQSIKNFTKLVADIYTSLHSPVPTKDDFCSGIKNYTDKNGKIHFSKMLRNSIASQRLYSFLDRIKETIFTHQYFAKEFELKNNKVDRGYLEIYMSRNLVFLDIQLVNGLVNFLSYLFDLPTIDNKIDTLEFRNFLYIRDKQICLEIEKIIKSDEFQVIETIFEETKNDYAGLSKISDRIIENQSNTIKIDSLKGYPLQKILSNSSELIKKLNLFLQFTNNHIKNNYKNTFGYNSSDDFVADVDKKSGYYRGTTLEEIEKAKQNIPIKIFNFVTDSPQKIDNTHFILYKNHTFEDIKDNFYRRSPLEQTTIKIRQKFPNSIEKKIYKPQEGKSFWTHTLIIKKNSFGKESKLIIGGDFSEDISLLLSLFSGVGIYTEHTVLHYSHKTKLPWKLHYFEFENAMHSAIEKIESSKGNEIDVLGLALSKYREAMQPMSDNNRLVRLWEILDILGDFYCQEQKKQIPTGYNKKSLKEKIEQELKEVEKRTGIPLIQEKGFAPILINKSILQRIRELMESLKIHSLIKVDLTEFNKKLSQVYSFRSKLTHSAKVDFKKEKNKKNLMNYYLFISQLVFIVLLVLFKTKPDQTLLELKANLCGFIKDEKYYQKKSNAIKKNNEKFNEFGKYLTGEKNLPPNLAKSSNSTKRNQNNFTSIKFQL